MILTIVYVEPDWCIAYLDGVFFGEGHDYDDMRLVRDAVNHNDVTRIETECVDPDEWKGSPKTLEECIEEYQNT